MLLVTSNVHKRDEFSRLAPDLSWLTFSDWAQTKGIDRLPSIEETGVTFAENAIIKARAGWERTGLLSLADDSGLCVDVLDGAPGIKSARYVEGSDVDRYQALLKALVGVEESQRSAAFHCVLALCGLSEGQVSQVNTKLPLEGVMWQDGCLIAFGRCEGVIRDTPYGDGGFGYDPIFNLKDGRSFASITGLEKDKFSHRGVALRALRPLSKIFS